MQYRLDLIESGLNYYLNSNHKKYLAQTQRPIFLRFGKFPPQICESYGATYWLNWKKIYCLALCKVHLVLQQTMETTSNSIHNWRRYPSSNCYKIDENVRFWIWHSVVAPSDAAEKTAISMHNYNPSCTNSPGDIWENLLPVWLRWPCWTVDELMNLELLTSHIFYSKSYMLCMRQTLNNKVIYKQRSLKKTQSAAGIMSFSAAEQVCLQVSCKSTLHFLILAAMNMIIWIILKLIALNFVNIR